MFADLKSFFAKLGGNKITVALIVLVVGFALFTYSGSKGGYKDTFASSNTVPATLNDTYQNPPIDSGVSASTSGAASAGGYTMKPVANPTDLLPADGNSQWTALNPSAQNGMMMPDLLQAGYHIGLDTIGQTLKNPNLQLRSDPVIAKKDIGPWNLSTYEGDPFRVPLEIGVSPAAA